MCNCDLSCTLSPIPPLLVGDSVIRWGRIREFVEGEGGGGLQLGSVPPFSGDAWSPISGSSVNAAHYRSTPDISGLSPSPLSCFFFYLECLHFLEMFGYWPNGWHFLPSTRVWGPSPHVREGCVDKPASMKAVFAVPMRYRCWRCSLIYPRVSWVHVCTWYKHDMCNVLLLSPYFITLLIAATA